ncbi:Prefoldin subunit-domain-containing protein [Xylariales sp. PMI_506]|nr:Prefoldin subunit-domain-containing protein [Xylariales sp. PMI_506]
MAAVKDRFLDLEKHRQLLEQNVNRLSDALDEWRQWKTEYNTLRADVQSVPNDAPPHALTDARQAYRGDLVDDKVLAEIFGKDGSKKRDQVLSVLANRIDYVTKNIATLGKQLEAAENKLATANIISDPDLPEDENGLPITEIMEELDEDDNVVSYSLRTPGNNQSELVEALAKAGLKEIESSEEPSESGKQPQKDKKVFQPVKKTAATTSSPQKKGVTFTNDTKSGEEQKRSKTAEKVEELMRQAREQESTISQPVIPADESEDEAQLRRDMLQYNLSELNPVVAELSIEEGDYTDDDFGSEAYSEYDDDEEEDEDQWGRSRTSVMSDEYRQKMQEIQDRLSKHIFGSDQNGETGKEDDENSDSDDDMQEGIGRIQVKVNEQPDQAKPTSSAQEQPKTAPEAKKSVRFAQALDIAAEPSLPSRAPVAAPVAPVKQPKKQEVDPLSELVVERSNASSAKPVVSAPTKKPSRFKAARASEGTNNAEPATKAPTASNGTQIAPELPLNDRPIAPSGPEGQTMATTILEKEPSLVPREPDEFDADLLKQEVAVEYYKARNRMIHKQGGFMKEDESPIQPLSEEEGGPKRLSRFKAARLAKS